MADLLDRAAQEEERDALDEPASWEELLLQKLETWPLLKVGILSIVAALALALGVAGFVATHGGEDLAAAQEEAAHEAAALPELFAPKNALASELLPNLQQPPEDVVQDVQENDQPVDEQQAPGSPAGKSSPASSKQPAEQCPEDRPVKRYGVCYPRAEKQASGPKTRAAAPAAVGSSHASSGGGSIPRASRSSGSPGASKKTSSSPDSSSGRRRGKAPTGGRAAGGRDDGRAREAKPSGAGPSHGPGAGGATAKRARSDAPHNQESSRVRAPAGRSRAKPETPRGGHQGRSPGGPAATEEHGSRRADQSPARVVVSDRHQEGQTTPLPLPPPPPKGSPHPPPGEGVRGCHKAHAPTSPTASKAAHKKKAHRAKAHHPRRRSCTRSEDVLLRGGAQSCAYEQTACGGPFSGSAQSPYRIAVQER